MERANKIKLGAFVLLSGVLLIVALTLDVFSRRRQQKRLGV